MSATYHADNKVYRIGACDFAERLVGLMGVIASEPTGVSWVRCENVTLTKLGSCARCNGDGWVPSKNSADTDPCPLCVLPNISS
jgi:hypothetical protein